MTAFSHVYFFASAPISRSSGTAWNHELFEKYSRVYVRAFAALVSELAGFGGESKPRFFYPSTVFVEQYERGFAEYVCAKAAGEAVCDQLSLQYGICIDRPRLPRMRTDQTSGLGEGTLGDPFPFMLALARRFHGL